jgi:glycosyltransferase involved in cell wall biosynthesis
MSPLRPYVTPEAYDKKVEEILRRRREAFGGAGSGKDAGGGFDYAGDLYREVHRYASMAMELAREEEFDVIHAHDWMTYPAAVGVALISGKPLVVHIHSTEFDRSGEHVNQMVYDIERQGLQRADKVIAVSQFTRGIVISRYGIPGDKVEVVYNGVERNGNWSVAPIPIHRDEKIVLFLGRITMQKGPEYFLYAAKKVLEVMDNVKFVMAGSGDLMHRSVELAAQLGIGHKVLFTGFLRGDDVQRIFKMADLYVMPSVSEPFGIAPLEALDNDVPVIISKQSGVSEVLRHALKVDFWDVNEMANKMVAVLKYPPLQMTLRSHGNFEVRKLRWRDAARHCLHVYQEMLVTVPQKCGV